jgi:regulatory protein YycH of two-component signal transduction system YycFG
MGLKYVEQIKSIALFVLVFLSITLTFSIWTYKPNYDTIEPPKVFDSSIGKQLQMSDIIKPYRVLFHMNGKWKGTNENVKMESILSEMKKWELSDLTLVSNNLDDKKLNELIGMNNRMTLFYTGEIPFPVFLQNLLPTQNKKINEAAFNRMIIDWNKLNNSSMSNNELIVFFANSKNNKLYKAKIKVQSGKQFQTNVVTVAKSFPNYLEIEREGAKSFYLPTKAINMPKYTYIIEPDPVNSYKNALFSDPNIVKRSPDEVTGTEKYTDDKSLMTIDVTKKTLNFVNTSIVENKEKALESDLILNTFSFINEHGGWTGDFRYSEVDYGNQKVTYQMYLKDQPVFSDRSVTLTEISTYWDWGNGRISKYYRPYYQPVPIPLVRNDGKLMSGPEAIEKIKDRKDINFEDIEEIRSGFYLTKNANPNLFTLEPMWFYSINGKWEHLSPVIAGGDPIGLE